MIRFILRRTGSLVLLLIAVSFITFTLFQLGPADPASAACGQECTPQRVAEARVALGMDQPFFLQYADYMRGLVSPRMIGAPGAESVCQWPCLGKSFQTNENVSDIISRSLPYTVSMAVGALVLWTVSGVGLGLLAALRKGSATDKFIVGAASVGVSLPIPVTGLFLLLVFVNQLHLLPFTTNEINSPFGTQGPWAWVLNYLLPWIALAVLFSASYIRVTRTNMIETFGEDFIRACRTKQDRLGRAVQESANAAGASAVIHAPGVVMPALCAVLNLVVRDVLLTRDEYWSMADGLADTNGPNTAPTSINEWVAEHGLTLGLHYANELDRHLK